MSHTTYSLHADPDIYDEDKSDIVYLTSKPSCFAVFGPPGSGKSTVARIISHFWKCLLLSPETVTAEALSNPETTRRLKEYLHGPGGIPEDVALELLRKKLDARETHHYGYVLDDFPTPEIAALTLEEQFDLLRNLGLRPDFVVIIRFPLEDAVRRKEKLYTHIPTGISIPVDFIEETKDYAEAQESRATEFDSDEERERKKSVKVATSSEKDKSEESDGEKGEATDDEEESSKDEVKKNLSTEESEDTKKSESKLKAKEDASEDGDELLVTSRLRNTKKTTFDHYRRELKSAQVVDEKNAMKQEIAKTMDEMDSEFLFFRQLFFPGTPIVKGKMLLPNESLFLRLEDSVEWTQDDYLDYKRLYLPHLENFMASYYPLRVIEIDGNMPLHLIPKLVLSRLECMRLQKPPVPHPLSDSDVLQSLLEEIPDDLEKQFDKALSTGAISPRWRWRRSVWRTFCPVSLFEGTMVAGSVMFATVFMDRLYLLADKEKQEKFIQSPKLYLLPPNPKVPVRLAIFGAPGCGRSSLAYVFHDLRGYKLLDAKGLSDQVITEQKDKGTADALATATNAAVERIYGVHLEELSKTRAALASLAGELRTINPRIDISTAIKDAIQEEHGPPEEPIRPSIDRASFDEAISLMPPQTPRFSVSFLEPDYTEEEKIRILQLEADMEVAYASFVDWEAKLESINDSHSKVLVEIEQVMETFVPDVSIFDAERYVELVKEVIMKGMGRSATEFHEFRGWILDNLHTDARAFTLLLELPDEIYRITDVLVLRDATDNFQQLRQIHVNAAISKRATFSISDEEWEGQSTVIRQIYEDIKVVENAASAAGIRVHSFDIAEILPEKIVESVSETHRALFKFTPVDYEVEEETEGDEEPEEGEDDNEEEKGNSIIPKTKTGDENSEKTKPIGDTADYCPVALKEFGTLWPGNTEHGSLMYKDKIYVFSTPEAKEKFSNDPERYLPVDQPLQLPPLRIFVAGTVGSGRTTHARMIAEISDAFVINIRNYMIETATPKLQKTPVETFRLDPPTPYWRLPKQPLLGSSDMPKPEKELPTGLLPIKLPFLSTDPENPLVPTSLEQACADSLTSNSALPSEILNELLDTWTTQPPFAGRNIVFDGFPANGEDAALLIERGMFPDVLLLTSAPSDALVKRVLPIRKKHWTMEKKKRDDRRLNSYLIRRNDWEKRRSEKKKVLLEELAVKKRQKELDAEQRRAEAKMKGDDDEAEAEPEDEEEDDDEETRIEDMLTEEFVEPQVEDEKGEEDESELEEDAIDRISEELQDKVEQGLANMDAIKEAFEEQRIPTFLVNTARPQAQAVRSWMSKVKKALETREHILEKAYPVSGSMAKQMIDVHYKRLGKFGTWCPVKNKQGHLFPPASKKWADLFPVVYRQYVYLCSTNEMRLEFLSKPEFFVRQMQPRLCIPLRIAVIGPPQSGKTTFCRRVAHETGVPRISIGDAVRYVHSNLKSSELHRIVNVYLVSGTELPDTLEILCLEAFLRTTDCQARGWVLDGYPTTFNKVNIMMQRFIVPTVVFELAASNKTCVLRSVIENMSTQKSRIPMFNNSHVIATRLAHYKNHLPAIKHYLENYTRNLIELDATSSKWMLWYKGVELVAHRTVLVQDYVERREKRHAAPLTGLCVTPFQLQSRLSEAYGVYCPVTLNQRNILFDCVAHETFDFIVEYREKYYLFATKEKMDLFLENPDVWLPPVAVRVVPPKHLLAKRIGLDVLGNDWSGRLGFGGMDSVVYFNSGCLVRTLLAFSTSFNDGNRRQLILYQLTSLSSGSSGLEYGSSEWTLEYRTKIYLFSNADNLDAFIAEPEKFSSVPEPTKRPPHPEHPPELDTSMPAVPFLETRLGPILVQALLEVAELRPKYPHFGYKESALIFLANYLKCKDPDGTVTSRNVSKEKLLRYEEVSRLASDLMLNVQGMPEYGVPGPQHVLFEQADQLSVIKKELENEWHTLSPF